MKAKENRSKEYLYKYIVKAKLFIDTHYAENIQLNQIASQAHFSKFHFIRLFRKTYGFTPNQYLTKVRIDNAKSLLAADHSINDVCFLIGYDSVSTFKKLFKKTTLFTPLTFKNSQLYRKRSMQENPFLHVPQCLVKKMRGPKKAIFDTEGKDLFQSFVKNLKQNEKSSIIDDGLP